MREAAALVVLTVAFVPAAVLGALPLVAPVVGALVLCVALVTAREPTPENPTDPPRAEEQPRRASAPAA